MDILSSLGDGFAIALTWQNLLLALLGCFLGTVMGALPGLGPSNGVAILIPLAFTLGLGAITNALQRQGLAKAFAYTDHHVIHQRTHRPGQRHGLLGTVARCKIQLTVSLLYSNSRVSINRQLTVLALDGNVLASDFDFHA